MLAAGSHPNLLALHGVFHCEAAGEWALVLDWCPESIESMVLSIGVIPQARMTRICGGAVKSSKRV